MPAGMPWLLRIHARYHVLMGMLMHASQRGTSSGMDHNCWCTAGKTRAKQRKRPEKAPSKLSNTTLNLLVVWPVRVTVTHNRAGRHCWPRHIMVGPLRPNFVVSLLSSLQQALNSSNQFFVFVSFLPSPLFFLFSIIELCSIDLVC